MHLLLALLAVALPAADTKPVPHVSTQRRINLILSTPAAMNARWGVHAVQLGTGKVAYQVNAQEHFTPASNTKLFSTSLALERLGTDYRYVTTVRAGRGVSSDGQLQGDLRLVGGGDPTLSGRAYPYQKTREPIVNPMASLEDLADQILQRGVREITGDIVGDDRLYVYAPYPEGWTIDDSIWEYGAPVSALPFNDSAFSLVLRPGSAVGDLATVSTNPPSLPLLIDSRVVTTASGRPDVQFDRLPGSRQLRVWGKLPRSGNFRQLLAVDDAAYYAAYILHDILTRRGVLIRGVPQALHRYSIDEAFDPAFGVELARRVSPPLIELARVVNKVSQNLHAELLLREVARVKQQQATREAGLKEMAAFLKEIGVDDKAYHFEDGSGLSRRTLVSPMAITQLLRHMDSRGYGKDWDSLMPIGSEDGTLENRFDRVPAANSIHAKTGTLATANALSGYLTTKRGARLAFSIIANNNTGPSSEIRKVIDRIGLALLEWEGN